MNCIKFYFKYVFFIYKIFVPASFFCFLINKFYSTTEGSLDDDRLQAAVEPPNNELFKRCKSYNY